MEDQGDQSEHDLYISQLKEVFDSCDQTGSQALNREELYTLCERLQLDDQSEYLVNELLKEKDEVDFEVFKGSFVRILCQTYASVPMSEEELESTMSEADRSGSQPEDRDGGDETEAKTDTEKDDDLKSEVSPKYVVGNKRYGRRSLPVSAEELDSFADDFDDDEDDEMEEVMSSASLKHSLVVADASDSDEDGGEAKKKRRRRAGDSGTDEEGTETFEAEGQMNLMMADSAKLTEDEKYLRDIWKNLGVGRNGFISIDELAQVCTHIGMDEMNQPQLQQLFNKLDADGDGRVSFQEFLQEMFQHHSPTLAPGPPRSVGTTPTRALSAQKKLKYPGQGSEERVTPSIIQGSGVSGFFSTLDPGKTGFATPEAVVDLWEKYHLTNGLDVLMSFGFDPEAKVNLVDLSAVLEQELLNADEQNICLHAAAVSYQQELRTLKSSLEQAGWAKEKLKLDLAEANARNSLLAKEVDERHASMEKSSESKLLTVEKKYQEQLRSVQGELEKERQNFTAYAARHKQNIEADMDELRQEEAKLRKQISLMQKEIGKLNSDLTDVSSQLEESDRHNQRLQREIGGMQDIHRKLAEFERAGIFTPDEHKFAKEKIQRLEQENKDLKDQNDELKTELDETKIQTSPNRRGLGAELAEDHIPIRRDGSLMSDYIKPVIMKKASFSSADYSDDDAQQLLERRLQQLSRDDDDISLGSTSDRETIEQLNKEIEDLKKRFEIERKDIEEGYRLEIASVEERHDQEKKELLLHIEHDKKNLEAEFQRLQEDALAELAKDLQNSFTQEKEDIVQKHESEKNLIRQQHTEEIQEIIDRYQVEGDHNLKSKVQELKTRHKQDREELESALDDSKARIQELEALKTKQERQKNALQEQVAQLEEYNSELEQHNKELQKKCGQLEESMKAHLKDSEEKMLKQKTEMEGMLTRHLENVSDVEGKKHDLENRLKKQIDEAEKKHNEEKQDLTKQVEDIKETLRKDKQKFAKQVEDLKEKHKDEAQEFTKQVAELKEDMKKVQKQKEQTEVELKQFNAEKFDLLSQIENQKREGREVSQQMAQMELELGQQREEMEVSFRQEKQELQQLYEERLRELQEAVKEKEREKADILAGDGHGLAGGDKEDYNRLVTRLTEEAERKAQRNFTQNLNQREKELEDDFDTKKSELTHVFEREKSELMERYEDQVSSLRTELDRLQGKLEEEREALAQRFEDEREALEEQLAQQVKEELEEEFCEQMEEIKEAYDDAKRGFEAESNLLNEEIEDLKQSLDKETKNRKQLEELRRTNTKLQQEKRQAEKGQYELKETLEETKRALEARIDQLMAEKEGAISAVKAEFVESSRQSGRDKAGFDAVLMEKEDLEKKLGQLQQELSELHNKADTVDKLQVQVATLTRENTDLTDQLQSRQEKLQAPLPEHAQRAISELTQEKSELEERLVDTENKLEEIEEMAKKYTHLQFDFGQLSIGQSALEESLLDTQDKLADTEAELFQAEKELKYANRYVDKYRLIKKKYEDVCKERDRSVGLAKSLKEQLNKINSGQHEDMEDKKQLTKVLEQKKMLETQLQQISDKLLEATTNFTMSQSEHQQEVQQWQDRCSSMVDMDKYTRLQIDLVQYQRSLREMQELAKSKVHMASKVFKETSDKHQDEVTDLEGRKQLLEDKLKTLQLLLDNHVKKFKEQCETAERRNMLVVNLYKENADLMDSLAHVEEQKKDAVSRCYRLEDQCNELRRAFRKMTTLAVT